LQHQPEHPKWWDARSAYKCDVSAHSSDDDIQVPRENSQATAFKVGLGQARGTVNHPHCMFWVVVLLEDVFARFLSLSLLLQAEKFAE